MEEEIKLVPCSLHELAEWPDPDPDPTVDKFCFLCDLSIDKSTAWYQNIQEYLSRSTGRLIDICKSVELYYEKHVRRETPGEPRWTMLGIRRHQKEHKPKKTTTQRVSTLLDESETILSVIYNQMGFRHPVTGEITINSKMQGKWKQQAEFHLKLIRQMADVD